MADELNHHLLNLVDCECGKKLFVLDHDRSRTVPKPWQRRVLKKRAKELGRQYSESGTVLNCPGCSRSIDLSTPDEKYKIEGDAEMTRVG